MQIKKNRSPLDDCSARPVTGIPLFPWGGVAKTPFESGIYTIKPTGRTRRHGHYEAEFFTIISGSGEMSLEEDVELVDTGDTVFLPAFSKHTLWNTSDSVPLVYLAVWWPDLRDQVAPIHPLTILQKPPQKSLIFVSRPTPNSDLHLGHLAGPYIAADILARSSRLSGLQSFMICGTDDHQTYVSEQAIERGLSPSHVGMENSKLIRSCFNKFKIHFDLFTNSSISRCYKSFVQDLVRELIVKESLLGRMIPTLFCESCSDFKSEGHASGRCVNCHHPTNADMCDNCGQPNFGTVLLEPECSRCGSPLVQRSLNTITLNLETFRPQIQEFLKTTSMSLKIQEQCEHFLCSPLPEIPISISSNWGIELGLANYANQRISPWFEVAASVLWHLSEANPQINCSKDTIISHVFGCDNAFIYTVYLPAILLAAGRAEALATSLISNQHYCLNGSKFSSSRTNLVFGSNILDDYSSDLVRFYLSQSRPEVSRTSFSSLDFTSFVNREICGFWEPWLQRIEDRVRVDFNGLAPATGDWNSVHQQYYQLLLTTSHEVLAHYDPRQFSPRQAAIRLSNLVRLISNYSEFEGPSDATAMVLELTAVKFFANLISPIAPDLGRAILSQLSLKCSLKSEELLSLIPEGSAISSFRPTIEAFLSSAERLPAYIDA